MNIQSQNAAHSTTATPGKRGGARPGAGAPRKKNRLIAVFAKLDQKLIKALDAQAKKLGVTRSDIIREKLKAK